MDLFAQITEGRSSAERAQADFDRINVEEDAREAYKAAMDRGEPETAPVGRHALDGLPRVAGFVFAGRAIFTLENSKTGQRFTYKVEQAKARPEDAGRVLPFFVNVLTGSNNESDYSYLGCLWGDGTEWEGLGSQTKPGALRYAHGRKSRIAEDAPSAKGIAWLAGKLARGESLGSTMKVYHEGRCGRCGRLLTVPSSIESGIGPVCAEMEG
jgi:hypothetical protein